MHKLVFSLVLMGLAASFAFSQGDGATRSRVVSTPTPQTTTDRNDTAVPQSGASSSGRPVATPPPGSKSGTGDDEEIKVETNLVTMPVSVVDRDGRFVTGLVQGNFEIFEDGTKQKIEYFQSVEHPFTVVLLIDVSPSTKFRMEEIQNAAISFIDQLRPTDRVVVMSFDKSVKVLSAATSNREQLRNAIRMAKFGDGTSLYEAVDRASGRDLRLTQGRKALVIFTDGVDTTSRLANRKSTIDQVEADDALVFPIRYNTHLGRKGITGGWNPSQRRRVSGWGGAIGVIIDKPASPEAGGGSLGAPAPDEYEVGREYLEELARKSGGRQFEADSTTDLNSAFAGIAEELRRQYYIGYYPELVGEKGDRRQIKVQVTRPGLIVRSKSSYIVGSTADSSPPGN